jgi:large subunit ribosomal protein L18
MRIEKKQKLKQLRRWRIRNKVQGTADRPRMAVCFTGKNIYVQFIDDLARKTLAAASTVSKNTPDAKSLKANVSSAQTIGKVAAEAARSAGSRFAAGASSSSGGLEEAASSGGGLRVLPGIAGAGRRLGCPGLDGISAPRRKT